MSEKYHKIYVASNGTEIIVSRGSKPQSPYDFRVHYKSPGKRVRTPKHIHLIIDLYLKMCGDERNTLKLVDHILNNIIRKVKPAVGFPPKLQIFEPGHARKFEMLNKFGEYPVDFLLVVSELIMIQEKTNYPNGTLNLELFRKFRDKAGIFEVVSAATFRGR